MDIGNIYSLFRQGEEWLNIPFIEVPVQVSDKPMTYIPGESLMTKISQKYYGNPFMGKFIMIANPHLGADEFSITEEVVIRIPFPLNAALTLFSQSINLYLKQ